MGTKPCSLLLIGRLLWLVSEAARQVELGQAKSAHTAVGELVFGGVRPPRERW